MNPTAILKMLELTGSATPAFKALFDAVLPLFGRKQQAELQAAYETARLRSDDAHADLQQAARDAGA